MISPFKKAKKIIIQIDDFFNVIDCSINVFYNGVESYLTNKTENFNKCIDIVKNEERKADLLLKDIELALYKYSLIPEMRSDVMRLIQKVDDIADKNKEVLVQFNIEKPYIPENMHENILELTEISVKSVKEANKGSRMFFRNPLEAKIHIETVLKYEHNADELAEEIKRNIFQNSDNISLPEKFHIRYFTGNIEKISDIAKSISDTLNLMLIKRFE